MTAFLHFILFCLIFSPISVARKLPSHFSEEEDLVAVPKRPVQQESKIEKPFEHPLACFHHSLMFIHDKLLSENIFDSGKPVEDATGFEETMTTVRNSGSRGSVYWNGEKCHIIVAFRGSLNSSDWQTNTDVFSSLKNPVDIYGKKIELSVHPGFWNLAFDYSNPDPQQKKAKSDIIVEVKRLAANAKRMGCPRPKITVTGHSLGGAVATLFAPLLYKRLDDDTKRDLDVVVFGTPKVSDQDIYKQLKFYAPIKHYRTSEDYIANLNFGGNLPGKEVVFGREKKPSIAKGVVDSFEGPLKEFPDKVGNKFKEKVLDDHVTSTYLNELDKICYEAKRRCNDFVQGVAVKMGYLMSVKDLWKKPFENCMKFGLDENEIGKQLMFLEPVRTAYLKTLLNRAPSQYEKDLALTYTNSSKELREYEETFRGNKEMLDKVIQYEKNIQGAQKEGINDMEKKLNLTSVEERKDYRQFTVTIRSLEYQNQISREDAQKLYNLELTGKSSFDKYFDNFPRLKAKLPKQIP